MREYELTVVLKPDLDDEVQAEVLGRISGWLDQSEDEEGSAGSDHWGLKSLAYPIDDYTEGYYVFYQVEFDPTNISEIERNILYVDEVLRHLVVRKGG
jgi:small subunit ribosomal protein S6